MLLDCKQLDITDQLQTDLQSCKQLGLSRDNTASLDLQMSTYGLLGQADSSACSSQEHAQKENPKVPPLSAAA